MHHRDCPHTCWQNPELELVRVDDVMCCDFGTQKQLSVEESIGPSYYFFRILCLFWAPDRYKNSSVPHNLNFSESC